MDYYPLGMLPDESFEAYREAPGSLEEGAHCNLITLCSLHFQFVNRLFNLAHEGLWRRIKWDWPEDETKSCWW